jgi:hypothetical protein
MLMYVVMVIQTPLRLGTFATSQLIIISQTFLLTHSFTQDDEINPA